MESLGYALGLVWYGLEGSLLLACRSLHIDLLGIMEIM